MAAEAYRASMVDNPEAERRAIANFMRACEMTAHGPFFREIGMSRDLHMMVRELPMMMRHFLREEPPSTAPE